MPILIEDISAVVIALVLLILLANGVLIALTIVRRQRRERYLQRIDGLRARFGPVIAGALAQKIDYQRGLALLQQISGLDRDYVLEQLSMGREPRPAEVPIFRQLRQDLGLVQVWRRHLAGRFDVASMRDAFNRPEGVVQRVGRLSFLLRARSAEYRSKGDARPRDAGMARKFGSIILSCAMRESCGRIESCSTRSSRKNWWKRNTRF